MSRSVQVIYGHNIVESIVTSTVTTFDTARLRIDTSNHHRVYELCLYYSKYVYRKKGKYEALFKAAYRVHVFQTKIINNSYYPKIS